MNSAQTVQPNDRVTLARECDVTQIPSGQTITLPAGTEAVVIHSLGGYLTLQIPVYAMLVQLSARNLDALLKNGAPVAATPDTAAAVQAGSGPVTEQQVWEVLKTCYDPEIPLNIVDLGLVYDVKLTPLPSNRSRVEVKMTLTAMGCGMGPVIAAQARDKLLALPGVEEAEVTIVWDPPWNQSMISEEGRKRLGLW